MFVKENLDRNKIPTVIDHIIVPAAELVMPTGTSTNEANAGTEAQPLTAKTRSRKCLK